MKNLSLLLMLAMGLALASPASAVSIGLTASLDCAQADAGNGTCGAGGSGTGSAIIVFDTVSNLLSWNLSWSGLSAPATLIFFHGPALPNQNAGIQVDIGSIGGLSSPSIGAANLTDIQETDLLNELWYISIHNQNFPQGEIRGQVTVNAVPEPGTLALAGLGLAALVLARRRSRLG